MNDYYYGAMRPYEDPEEYKERRFAERLEKIANSPELARILAIEPRLVPIIEAAKHPPSMGPDYNYHRAYAELKAQARKLVGRECQTEELKGGRPYDCIIYTISMLLPDTPPEEERGSDPQPAWWEIENEPEEY